MIPGSDPPEDRFGPYLIRGRLGEGGTSVVFRADQQTPIRRSVALKVLKAGVDSKRVLTRFENERANLVLAFG